MIERLRLQNFQGHKDFRIKFDPNVTTIVGPSDTGKSSILRAIRWLVQGRPAGDSVVREGTDFVKVSCVVDGRMVQRRKGKDSYYVIDGGDKNKATGRSVPEDVVQLFNTGDVNFQWQHDASFWFSLTPGQVSKELNEVVNLAVIDEALKDVAQRLRKARIEEEITAKRMKEAERGLLSLEWVDAMEKGFAKLEKRRKEIEEENRKCVEVEQLTEDVEDAKEVVQVEVPDISGLKEQRGELDTAEKWMKDTDRLWGEYVTADDGLNKVVSMLDKKKKQMREEFGDMCPLCGARRKL